ncbi:FAD-dependent oxidoreductase [Demetria terragena]|uniref:FAD-dependent oxidoreductase n=1 Tax=Demetria terragena TaxID=63959 RepID=UPI00037692A4|nr:FAD-dependent oxidoreductase [Demetria terragena]
MTEGQINRLGHGGQIDRARPVAFTVDGVACSGFVGDTIASALLAHGRHRVGDSVYRARPRGIVAAGVEEPNALVRIAGDYGESMLPATCVEVEEGMEVTMLRGIGVLDQRLDPAEYDTMNVHTDIAIVGAGPAGLAAAREAAATGLRVTVFEQDFQLGGDLLSRPDQTVEGIPAREWIEQVRAELEAAPNVRILIRTSVFGSYDGNYLTALEKRGAQFSGTARLGMSRQRVWHVRAAHLVLATGALERPIIFAGNDRPGVMLASAVQTYLGRYAVRPGKRVVFFTTNDSAYATAALMHDAGASVVVIDAREESVDSAARDALRANGIEVRSGSAVLSAHGDPAVSSVTIAALDTEGRPEGGAEQIDADLLAVAGGWNPTVHLHSQRHGSVVWDDDLAGFVAHAPAPGQALAGAIAGAYTLEACLAQGARVGAGLDAARPGGLAGSTGVGDAARPGGLAGSTGVGDATRPGGLAGSTGEGDAARPGGLAGSTGEKGDGVTRQVWVVAREGDSLDDHLVDQQRDQTAADVLRATQAGMRSVEHIKRYTSIGTGADQGKLSGVSTIGLLTDALTGLSASGSVQVTPGDIGTTTFRAPFTPVAFGALAGRCRGDLFDVARTTPAHPWHVAHGAVFEDVGQWKRARHYPRDGEDMDAAVARECRAAREGVAFMDATTLGKIEIRGADAPEFLNRIYTNAFAKLAVGKARYGVMCGVDGMIFDDGVSLRLADDRYLMTTTTGGAAHVLDWMEEWLQTEWPELDVTCTSVTEQWSTTAVVGPRSRDVIARLAPDLDVSQDAFGFMEFRETVLASGIPARICRISFSGELAFEINVATWYGLTVWEDVAEAGADLDITPYGTETMHVLRAEKAFPIVGQDTDGTVTPQDLGMSWVVAGGGRPGEGKEFIGKRSYARTSHTDAVRKELVSLLPTDRNLRLPEGAQVVEAGALGDYTGEGLPSAPIPMLGHVTSSYRSQALGRSFALALVKDGRKRLGDKAIASFGGQFAEVVIDEPVLFDKDGAKRDG